LEAEKQNIEDELKDLENEFKNKGVKAEIVVLGDLTQIQGDAKINLDVAEKIGIPVTSDISDIEEKIKL